MATTLERLLWKTLWVSFDLPEEELLLFGILKETPPGGLIFFRRHWNNTAELLSLLRNLLLHSREPPQTALDEEGGPVRRLPPDLPAFPSPEEWGNKDPQDLYRGAKELGLLLRSLGFSLNLAPVADSCPHRQVPPVLKGRLFKTQPEFSPPYIRAFVRGMKAGRVATCLKHFPNHGLVSEDSHEVLPRLELPYEEVKSTSFPPFYAGVVAGAECLMLAHILWTTLDPRKPLSVSERAVATVRTDLSFSGLILSDDLEMKALGGYRRDDLVIEAIASGVNGILFCKNLAPVIALVGEIISEIERSSALKERLRQTAYLHNRLQKPQIPDPSRLTLPQRTW